MKRPQRRSTTFEPSSFEPDTAGLDEDRVRDWVVVREICNVLWTYEEHVRDGAPIQHDWVTAATTILKAVQR